MHIKCPWIPLFFFSSVFANPTGAQVQSGSATILANDTALEIHTSDQAIIHWETFSIDQGETTRFIQPNSSSIALNRVVGSLPSSINGLLEGNGRVILVNPHGVLIGPNGIIRVADFIASTHDIFEANESAFENSAIHFPNNTWESAIAHHGTIDTMSITAEGGKILLVADTLTLQGDAQAASFEGLAHHDLIIQSGCDIDATGPIHLISHQGSILIDPDPAQPAAPIFLSSTDHIHLLAHDDLVATPNGTFTLQTRSQSQTPSRLEASHGTISFHAHLPSSLWQITQIDTPTSFIAGNDLIFTSQSTRLCNITMGKPSLFQSGRHFHLHTHHTGKATITANQELSFSVGGDMSLIATSKGSPEIIVARALDAYIAGNLILEKPTGSSQFPDVFLASVGAVSITASGNVTLGRLSSIGSGNGPILIKSQHDIHMCADSSISLLSFISGARQPITLVVDDQSTGTGSFIMESGARIGTDPAACAPVQIFTSRRTYNQIDGLINGVPFVPGKFSMNTATEQWSMTDLYGSLNIEAPYFIIFYKEPKLGPIFSVLSQTIGNAFALTDRFDLPLPPYRSQFCITDPSGKEQCELISKKLLP